MSKIFSHVHLYYSYQITLKINLTMFTLIILFSSESQVSELCCLVYLLKYSSELLGHGRKTASEAGSY